MSNYMTKTIVDGHTGEIKYDKTVKLNNMFDEEGYLFWTQKLQTRDFREIDYPDIGFESIAIFHLLTRRFLYDDNMLQIKQNKIYRQATITDFIKYLNISERQVRRYMKKLIDYKLIKVFSVSDGCKYYVINPIYCMFGKRLSVTLYCLFKDELNYFLPSNVKNEFDTRIKNGE